MTDENMAGSMPAELKTQWVEALRSGKYKQGTGGLYDPYLKTFCCLGVLEHCAMDGNVEIIVGGNYTSHKTRYKAMPSFEFYKEYGINFPLFEETGHTAATRLADMNDVAEMDFHSIADWIEKNVVGV
jgi:hypothetical protein